MPETAASSSTTSKPSNSIGAVFVTNLLIVLKLDSHQRFEHSEPGHSKPLAGVG